MIMAFEGIAMLIKAHEEGRRRSKAEKKVSMEVNKASPLYLEEKVKKVERLKLTFYELYP